MPRLGLALSAAALLFACARSPGRSSVSATATSATSTAGSGGMDGGGGGISFGGGGAGTGGAAYACPSAPESTSGPCQAPSSLVCPFASACDPVGCALRCIGAEWIHVCKPCGSVALACPASPPKQGDACAGTENNGLPCTYDRCAAQDDFATATCSGGAWQLHHALCDPGGCWRVAGEDLAVPCPASNVCVDPPACTTWPKVTCPLNPCVDQPLSCACAASLCPTGLLCTGTSAGRVHCAPPPGPNDPEMIVTGQDAPHDFQIDASSVYWTSTAQGQYRVRKAPIAGGVAQELAPSGYLSSLAIDAASAYFTDEAGGLVRKVPLGGGAVTPLASGQAQPSAMAVGGSFAYWVDYDPNMGASIMRAPVAGGAVTTVVTLPKQIVADLAVDAANVYWIDSSSAAVLAAPIAGGAPVLLAKGADITHIALDASDVYWSDHGAGEIGRVPKSGGLTTVLATNVMGPYGIAVDDVSAYWTAGFDGTVGKVDKAGGAPQVIATHQYQPTGVRVDGAHVYWTTFDSAPCGTLWRAKK